MKKIIAWPITWLFYYIGNGISKFEHGLRADNEWEWPYRLYNWFMMRSVDIQDWAKLSKPWTNRENKQTEE